MAKKRDDKNSSFRMFLVNLTFTNEPLWYRILIIVLSLIALLAIVYIIKEWVTAPLLANFFNYIKDSAATLLKNIKK